MNKSNLLNLFISLVVSLIIAVAYNVIRDEATMSNTVIVGCISFIVISIICNTVHYFYDMNKENDEDDNDEDDEIIDKYFYHNYANGICRVEHITTDEDGELVSEFSYIDKSGNYITDNWFDVALDFNNKGTTQVSKDEMFFIINKEGEVISKKYKNMTEASDYIAKVIDMDNNTVNFVNVATGKELWKNWKHEM